MIYGNDHRPAHVHVWGPDGEAVFILNCWQGPAELRENYGLPRCVLGKASGSSIRTLANFATTGSECMVTRREIELANERGQRMRDEYPQAIAARYDRQNHKIVIDLSSKLTLSFSPEDAQGLEKARPADLEAIELSPAGLGIHFPKLDADFYIPGLLEGLMGTKKWMAARLGQTGGRSRSRAKKAAARANGKLGGRPKKITAS